MELLYNITVDKEGRGSKDIGTNCRRHVVHSRNFGRCRQPGE